MDFRCQQTAIAALKQLASNDRQSIIIEGPASSGKTYLAKEYSRFVSVPDFVKVAPKVDDVRSLIDSCIGLTSPTVVCIENLDEGVLSASYALLKFLEEPLPNIYIIVTCTNLDYVPETIQSRSTVVSIAPPTHDDINKYAASIDEIKFAMKRNTKLWECVESFSEAKLVLDMTASQIAFFDSLDNLIAFNDTVSSMQWKLGHYDNNEETPLSLVIRYVMRSTTSSHVRQAAVECLNELNHSRMAKHAVVAKFLFEAKYCE